MSKTYREFIADPDRACAIIAHRAAWHAAPENSLAGIAAAIEAGYDVVEIDIRRSADGQYFLLHDDTLLRMAGIDAVPETLTLEQLMRIELRDRDGGPDNPMTSETVPSLAQVFELTRGRIFIDLDVKHVDMLPEVTAAARAMGVADEVDLKADLRTRADFDWISSAILPHGVPFMAKTRLEEADAETQLALLEELGPFMSELSFERFDQLLAATARLSARGIASWVNTLEVVVNPGFGDNAALLDPEAIWGRLIDAGVSAIQTDEPEALKTFLAGRRR
jgi:glycerophosphoryl diester phosphodiesterase